MTIVSGALEKHYAINCASCGAEYTARGEALARQVADHVCSPQQVRVRIGDHYEKRGTGAIFPAAPRRARRQGDSDGEPSEEAPV